jgi:hypothetical protein
MTNVLMIIPGQRRRRDGDDNQPGAVLVAPQVREYLAPAWLEQIWFDVSAHWSDFLLLFSANRLVAISCMA